MGKNHIKSPVVSNENIFEKEVLNNPIISIRNKAKKRQTLYDKTEIVFASLSLFGKTTAMGKERVTTGEITETAAKNVPNKPKASGP